MFSQHTPYSALIFLVVVVVVAGFCFYLVWVVVIFFFCSWDKSETNPSTLTSWSLEKLEQQRRPTPCIKEGSSQSGTRGSSLGRRVAAALPWKRQDCQDTVPCPCLSCMQLLTWCQTMGEMMRKDTFFLLKLITMVKLRQQVLCPSTAMNNIPTSSCDQLWKLGISVLRDKFPVPLRVGKGWS